MAVEIIKSWKNFLDERTVELSNLILIPSGGYMTTDGLVSVHPAMDELLLKWPGLQRKFAEKAEAFGAKRAKEHGLDYSTYALGDGWVIPNYGMLISEYWHMNSAAKYGLFQVTRDIAEGVHKETLLDSCALLKSHCKKYPGIRVDLAHPLELMVGGLDEEAIGRILERELPARVRLKKAKTGDILW